MTETTNVAETVTADTATRAIAPGADPRPDLAKAVAMAGRTLAAVRPDQFDGPTPCAEYTVRQLSNHLVAILRRVAEIGRGGDPLSIPAIADDVADGDWSKTWDAAAREVETVWSPPTILSRPLRLPFGTLPGAAAAIVYTSEFTLHTWDLATATGQCPSWDPAVLAVSLAAMRRAVPAEPRGGQVPFAAVVDIDADAPDIDRLVAWYGRQP
ncbi:MULTISPECIES: TIGR03086 family metal-binding protein [unclassified Streptomyces]|uniref:TIGR03086 family metal-binding protein n=1 Tax=unclassified Streptomyces TaxID=2593676 RepID=UPI002DD7F60E|nr:TIGR03086 family metal-binding protein [Streptomyces sp. NBC_01750]WSA98105.1 TIGR03086 family metal-binding protein [Streptomyces sp. NBC_01794]WSD37358.1 TIGR03086 family metal-binding protein [Streptomyces sp. NBC_01750]